MLLHRMLLHRKQIPEIEILTLRGWPHGTVREVKQSNETLSSTLPGAARWPFEAPA